MTNAQRFGSMVVAAAMLTLINAGLAFAADGTGRDYADHVRMCQQAMGFNGTHNPGVMHQGRSGWDPTHAC